MTTNVLVIGGTGKTGRKVVQQLQSLDQNVRIGSRSGQPPFDWQRPDTWRTALEGMDKVYITFQPDLAVPGALDAIEGLVKIAKQCGISKLVLLSGKGEREAELCEQVVIHSGIDFTIVRASWFMQNFSESFLLEPIQTGYVALPKADAKVPYVDTGDIAEVVVASLMNEGHNGQVYELTGPRVLTFKEVVEEIEKASGRNINFESITLPAYINVLKEVGVDSDYVWLINYLFSEVLDAPGNDVVSNDIEKVLGRKARDFSEYAQITAATGIWDKTLANV
ncbi:MAG: NAD(P)H-binding protein [Chitinophagales bacterium]|nr:NAD(P)H-binding protein [Chitinophagales bacterium]